MDKDSFKISEPGAHFHVASTCGVFYQALRRSPDGNFCEYDRYGGASMTIGLLRFRCLWRFSGVPNAFVSIISDLINVPP